MSEPDRQPVLEGERVRLRPTTPEDWPALYGVASDPLVWEVHPAHDRWQEPVFRAYFDAGLASGGALTVIDRATEQVIGASRYGEYDAEQREIEIGWTYYARSHWRTGHNREVKRLMLGHIFQWAETVVFTIGKDNHRSRTAIEAIGAVARPGRIEKPMAGRMAPHLVYELRRP